MAHCATIEAVHIQLQLKFLIVKIIIEGSNVAKALQSSLFLFHPQN